ncbi:MAG TPA: hypothetical protein VHC69_04590 [Polyangiaceae bacterium]|nr:hypothetical protein [Polyangiaceae bacterium]
MARLKMNRFAVVSVVAFATAGAVFSAACSSDNNPAPGGPDASTETGGKTSTGGSGSGGKSTGGSTSSSGGKSNTDSGAGGSSSGGETGDGSTGGSSTGGGDSGASTGGSAGDSGTSTGCPPTAADFYTDKCTDSKCTPFDNSKLEKFQNGKLPDIP